jgi:hypothetical protein
MLERKNIDRVFQENLKDLEIYPNKRVWNNIESQLNRKAAKEPIALWKKLSGIAMLLLAVVSAGLFYYDTNQNNIVQPQVSESEANTSTEVNETPLTPVFINSNSGLAENAKEEKSSRKLQKTIFVKKPNNNVIVTTNDISTVYSTIENKYVVDKNDFLEELNQTESITSRMESIPEKESPADTSYKKWSIGPTVAPVFYNSLQDGSPLNDALSGNTKTSDNALSIGVKINYQLSNKFFIQSGVNKVELAYNTQGVNALISSSKNASSNINTDKPGVILTPVRSGQNLNSGSELNKSSVSGELNQSIEYFELPIEMKYSLYDKKVGLNLVGGFSTLILSNNSVSMITQNNVTDLGNANNLNDFNFSGNVGVDLDYKISKSWYLNVAPMFKYQFNTYSNSAGNFRPYYFGLYSGLNYKF